MDEIQAIPRILLQDFSKTISFLSKAFSIDFILMSATVPEIKKFLLLDITIDLLNNKYYSMSFNDRYILHYNKAINCKEKLFEAIKYQHSDGKSVLSVVNTKKVAFHFYNELTSDYNENELFLLSSYFVPKHRKKIIEDITAQLEKNKKIILISTQVIEAGVDLDFDCGFREFAPFYSIIQTAGRVNRENRDEIKKTAKLTVFPQIGYTPYHQNDLLTDEVEKIL